MVIGRDRQHTAPRHGVRHPRGSGRLLFVTGGSGFLGRHVVKGPAAERWEIIAPDSLGLDLRNRSSVISTIHDWRPSAIIHTAYRRSDRVSIVDATRHVAEAAAAQRVRLVHVSSDAIFRGGLAPYVETDVPTPITDYGRYKRDAEQVVATTCPDAVIVRTSLLLGRTEMSAHELAVRDAITSGRTPTTFFTDETRSPLLVDDLAAALVELAVRTDLSGVLHLAGPDEISRAELAVLIARRHGWDETRLRFGTIRESGLVRPTRVVLDSSLARSHGIAVRGPRDW